MVEQYDNPEVELKDAQVCALDDILRDQEKLDALYKEAKRYAVEIAEQKRRAKNLNEDMKITATEVFGINAGIFKEFVLALDGDLSKAIQLLISKVDVLEMLQEKKVKATQVADYEE